jgi:hypothetical protein
MLRYNIYNTGKNRLLSKVLKGNITDFNKFEVQGPSEEYIRSRLVGYHSLVLQRSDHVLGNGNFNERLQYYEVTHLQLVDINTLPENTRLTYSCDARLVVNLCKDTICQVVVNTNGNY